MADVVALAAGDREAQRRRGVGGRRRARPADARSAGRAPAEAVPVPAARCEAAGSAWTLCAQSAFSAHLLALARRSSLEALVERRPPSARSTADRAGRRPSGASRAPCRRRAAGRRRCRARSAARVGGARPARAARAAAIRDAAAPRRRSVGRIVRTIAQCDGVAPATLIASDADVVDLAIDVAQPHLDALAVHQAEAAAVACSEALAFQKVLLALSIFWITCSSCSFLIVMTLAPMLDRALPAGPTARAPEKSLPRSLVAHQHVA